MDEEYEINKAFSVIADYIRFRTQLMAQGILSLKQPGAPKKQIQYPIPRRVNWSKLAPDVRKTCGSGLKSLDGISICIRDGVFVCVSSDELENEEKSRLELSDAARKLLEEMESDTE